MTVTELLELIHEQRVHNPDVVHFNVGLIFDPQYGQDASGVFSLELAPGTGKFVVTNLPAPKAAELALDVRRAYGATIKDLG